MFVFSFAHAQNEQINEAATLNELARSLVNTDTEKSMEYAAKALQISSDNHDETQKGLALTNYAYIFRIRGEFSQAMDYSLRAIKSFESIYDSINIISPLNNMSVIYREIGNYAKATEISNQCLDLAKKFNKSNEVSIAKVNLGIIAYRKHEYNNAINCFNEAMHVNKDSISFKELAFIQTNLGLAYLATDKIQEAKDLFEKSLIIYEGLNDKQLTTFTLIGLSEIYLKQNKYEDAKKYASKSLQISKELRSKYRIRDAYFVLSTIEKANKNYEKSYEYLFLHLLYKDSVNNELLQRNIAIEESNFKLYKKEKELQLLKEKEDKQNALISKQRLFSITITILGFIFAISSIVFYVVKKKIKIKNNMLTENKIKIEEKVNELNKINEELENNNNFIRQNNNKLIKINQKLKDLSKNDCIQEGNWNKSIKLIVETVASYLECTYVSVWMYEKHQDVKKLNCELYFDVQNKIYKNVEPLLSTQYPKYFITLLQNDSIIANDVFTHPDVQELIQSYFLPTQIKSLLDTPFFFESNSLSGVICCETIKMYKWTLEDILFLRSIAEIITIAHKAHHRAMIAEELEDNKEQYRSLIENFSHEYFFYTRNASGKYEYVSPSVEKILGLTSEQFLESAGDVLKNLRVNKKNKIDKIFKEKSGVIVYELQLMTNEHKIMYLEITESPKYNQSGNIIEYNGIAKNITDKKEKDLELLLAKHTLENAPIAIDWIDADGVIKYANIERIKMSGLSHHAHLIGKKLYEIHDRITKEKIDKYFRIIEHKKIIHEETYFVNKDGKKFPIEIFAGYVEFENKKYISSFISDISERKNAEIKLNEAIEELRTSEEELRQTTEELITINESLQTTQLQLQSSLEKEREAKILLQNINEELKSTQSQLVQSEKMASLGQLTAGIAHEINNPVNYINSSIVGLNSLLSDAVQLLKIYDEMNSENINDVIPKIKAFKDEIMYEDVINGIRELSKNITIGTNRVAEIVKSLRVFSRLDENDIKLTDLHDNIDSTLIMLHHLYKNRIEIIKEYQNIPKIECYAGRLNQVLMNILSNAIQAIEENGIITIKTYLLDEKEKMVAISIQDTGVGISQSNINKIFDLFFTTKDIGKGTGLGLAISIGIVKEHNGRIEVKSELGKGSEFIIILPIKQK
jgi:PAS domain S-box-containing protein